MTKQARRYFIACEKKLKQSFSIPKDYLSALKELVKQVELNQQQQKQLEEQAQK